MCLSCVHVPEDLLVLRVTHSFLDFTRKRTSKEWTMREQMLVNNTINSCHSMHQNANNLAKMNARTHAHTCVSCKKDVRDITKHTQQYLYGSSKKVITTACVRVCVCVCVCVFSTYTVYLLQAKNTVNSTGKQQRNSSSFSAEAMIMKGKQKFISKHATLHISLMETAGVSGLTPWKTRKRILTWPIAHRRFFCVSWTILGQVLLCAFKRRYV